MKVTLKEGFLDGRSITMTKDKLVVVSCQDKETTHPISRVMVFLEEEQEWVGLESAIVKGQVVIFAETSCLIYFKESQMQLCMECGKLHGREDLVWMNDHHGVAFKKVCPQCYHKVQKFLDTLGRYESDCPIEPIY